MIATPNSNMRSVDFRIIDRVFGMEGGFVLDFSNRTFAEFFQETFAVDIDDERWQEQGPSKAKRLRYYLRKADRSTALKTLDALWEYREASSAITDYPELDKATLTAYFRIIKRLGGTPPIESTAPTAPAPGQRVDAAIASALAVRLVEVSEMDPQARGYAFEKFLKDVFDAYGLAGRASFRLKGEQIDGSFMLDGETYLLEAKWTNARVDVATLHAFNGKVEEKAGWSRGLIISQSGFTEDGLHAFGRGKRVICMDGFDLHEVLSGRLHLAEVIARKVRRAAETGMAYVPVRDFK